MTGPRQDDNVSQTDVLLKAVLDCPNDERALSGLVDHLQENPRDLYRVLLKATGRSLNPEVPSDPLWDDVRFLVRVSDYPPDHRRHVHLAGWSMGRPVQVQLRFNRFRDGVVCRYEPVGVWQDHRLVEDWAASYETHRPDWGYVDAERAMGAIRGNDSYRNIDWAALGGVSGIIPPLFNPWPAGRIPPPAHGGVIPIPPGTPVYSDPERRNLLGFTAGPVEEGGSVVVNVNADQQVRMDQPWYIGEAPHVGGGDSRSDPGGGGVAGGSAAMSGVAPRTFRTASLNNFVLATRCP
jgi:hypothetical protein